MIHPKNFFCCYSLQFFSAQSNSPSVCPNTISSIFQQGYSPPRVFISFFVLVISYLFCLCYAKIFSPFLSPSCPIISPLFSMVISSHSSSFPFFSVSTPQLSQISSQDPQSQPFQCLLDRLFYISISLLPYSLKSSINSHQLNTPLFQIRSLVSSF